MTEDLPQELVQARIRLMLSEPYLASAVTRFPIFNAEGVDWCQTMATDGYHIYANPEFCRSLTPPQLSFVIAHEVLHCVLGHVDRRKDRDPLRWNIAIDFATNLMLVELRLEMPSNGLLDRQYTGLTAEEIYDRLPAKAPGRRQQAGRGGLPVDGAAGGGKGWDLHIDPSDLRGQATRTKDFPTALERERLRAGLIRELSAKGQGSEAATLVAEIRACGRPRVPWKTLLSRFMSGLRRDDYRLMPPNKKHLWRKMYLPSVGAPGPSHIVVAIDTSGSMGDKILRQVLSEVDRLRSVTQCHLTLIQCDAAIAQVQEFDEFSEADFTRMKIHGGGGTNFIPVFDWIRKHALGQGLRLDALVYLTDGFGTFPDKEPDYPVIWILESSVHPPVPFGQVIHLGDAADS